MDKKKFWISLLNHMDGKKRKLELLAPAGTLDAFDAAIRNGADAIYFGAPNLNARALARHFSSAEMAGMVAEARKAGVKVYPAMNSLVREDEIPAAVEMLALLEGMDVDAVIIQDLGVYYLIRKYFPGLRIHASTLLAAHNTMAVRQFGLMGFDRVVLARELTIDEIARIGRASAVDLEVFVHGALCFSFSGLCRFSSYLGGKSGLRGRCVQPCRRRYAWQGRGGAGPSGYFFSMNDLSGIDLIPRLMDAGVVSLKIEGRMRNARYVGAVVSAYRQVLDAGPDDQDAIIRAREILREAMGRKTTTGYFLDPQPDDAISPYHSGNTGLFLGKINKCRGTRADLVLREPVRVGDRLRVHQEGSGERHAFTLKELRLGKKQADEAEKGASVSVELPVLARSGDSLFLVDTLERRAQEGGKPRANPGRFWKAVPGQENKARIEKIIKRLWQAGRGARHDNSAGPASIRSGRRIRGNRERKGLSPLPWWLKIDDISLLRKNQNMETMPEMIVIALDKRTYSQYLRMRQSLAHIERSVIWSLPPVIFDNDESFYQEAVKSLRNAGFERWQIGHIGQLQLFGARQTGRTAGGGGHEDQTRCCSRHPEVSRKRRKPGKTERRLIAGDYTLNALNSLAMRALDDLGVASIQAAIETDRDNLKGVLMHRKGSGTGLTVYGSIPLFTARLAASHFRYDSHFISPKGEEFTLKKDMGLTVALATKLFSLLPHLSELAGMGLGYCVVDLCRVRLGRGDLARITGQLTGARPGKGLSSFNYNGRLE